MEFSDLVIETPAFVLEGRVAKGAAFLDERHPNWAERIDVSMLEGTCATHGILGQLFGADPADQGAALGIPFPAPDRDRTNEKDFEAVHGWTEKLVELGFYTWTSELREVPEMLRSLAKFVGEKLPAQMPMPRDESTVVLEAETLKACWEREIGRR